MLVDIVEKEVRMWLRNSTVCQSAPSQCLGSGSIPGRLVFCSTCVGDSADDLNGHCTKTAVGCRDKVVTKSQ